jgi:hypothetical protein
MGTISMKPKSLNSGNKHYLKDPKNFTSVLESFIIPIYTKGEKKEEKQFLIFIESYTVSTKCLE